MVQSSLRVRNPGRPFTPGFVQENNEDPRVLWRSIRTSHSSLPPTLRSLAISLGATSRTNRPTFYSIVMHCAIPRKQPGWWYIFHPKLIFTQCNYHHFFTPKIVQFFLKEMMCFGKCQNTVFLVIIFRKLYFVKIFRKYLDSFRSE